MCVLSLPSCGICMQERSGVSWGRIWASSLDFSACDGHSCGAGAGGPVAVRLLGGWWAVTSAGISTVPAKSECRRHAWAASSESSGGQTFLCTRD